MVEASLPPRIKVCGLSTTSDVEHAVRAGCDAIGIVRYEPSPRHVGEERAAELVGALPDGVLAVVVSVDAPRGELEDFVRTTGASAVQLCGSEEPRDWTDFPRPVLRRLAVDAAARDELQRWRACAAGFVLDRPGAPGGTGLGVDLALAAELAAAAPCLLAGGLDADGVAAAVRAVRPAGVDASSKLESTPGRKDPERVRAFVQSARRALEQWTP